MISDDTPILPIGGDFPDLRLRHCYEGTIVFGATGSGKTTGSGAALARGLLEANLGGLVLCAKPDEAERWKTYAKLTNREKDIILLSEKRFNFLQYQQILNNSRGGGLTENIVHTFYEAIQAFSRGKSQHSSSDPYWENASKSLLRNTIDLILLAGEPLTLERICEVIYDTPTLAEEGGIIEEDPENPHPYEFRKLFDKAINRDLTKRQQSDAELSLRFFEKDFGKLSEKTKGSIISSFTSMADGLMRGLMADILGTSLKVAPELSRTEKKIIIVDIDIMTYGELAKAVAVIFKTLWQKAMESFSGNPVFMFADESHFFQTHYDALFQSTCRGFKVCTVYLSQNKPGYLLELKDEHRIASLMGNLRNKFFHSNDCYITNQWAADLIGKSWQQRDSKGISKGNTPDQSSSNVSSQTVRDYLVQPEDFLSLKTGGKDFNNQTEAIFFRSPNYIELTFDQWPPLEKKGKR